MVENLFWSADDKHSCTSSGCETCNLKRIEANKKIEELRSRSIYTHVEGPWQAKPHFCAAVAAVEFKEFHLTRVQAHNTELTLQIRDLKAKVEELQKALAHAYGGGL